MESATRQEQQQQQQQQSAHRGERSLPLFISARMGGSESSPAPALVALTERERRDLPT